MTDVFQETPRSLTLRTRAISNKNYVEVVLTSSWEVEIPRCLMMAIKHRRRNESKIRDRTETRGTRGSGKTGGSIAAIIVRIQ